MARRQAGKSCDIVAEFLASCDKFHLSRGIYYTLVNAQCQRSASGWAASSKGDLVGVVRVTADTAAAVVVDAAGRRASLAATAGAPTARGAGLSG